MSKMAKLAKRNEIDDAFKWRLEDMVSSKEEWQNRYEEIIKLSEEMASYSGKLQDSADTLFECLQKKEMN